MATQQDLKTVQAVMTLSKGQSYQLTSFNFEHNPVGIVPSMGTLTVFALIDKDIEQPLDKYNVRKVPVTPGGRNYPQATGKIARSVRAGNVPKPEGSAKAFTIPEEPQRGIDAQAYKDLKRANVPKLSELLGAEFDVVIGADVMYPKNYTVKNKETGVDEQRVRIETQATGTRIHSLRVKRIEGVEEAPPTLNKIALIEITFADGRDKWSQLSNFSDDVNIFKGVSDVGAPTYENHSVWNPAAAQASRRAWSPKLLIEYLISLMEGFDIKGSRATGLKFEPNAEDYLVTDNNLSKGKGSYVVENLSERGANPALILRQHLRRWGMDIIYTHRATWYIDNITRSAMYPTEELIERATDAMPRSDNARSLRAKECVILGNPVKFQEGFVLTEHTDFDFVVPINGRWVQMDYAWRRISRGVFPDPDDYNDANRASYLTAKEREVLDLLAAVPPGDDYETWLAESHTVRFETKTEANYRMLLALFSVADNGHRYIRLRTDGVYGHLRRPLKNLISIDSFGDGNRPVVVAPGWASYKFRFAATAQKDFRFFNTALAAFKESNALVKEARGGEDVPGEVNLDDIELTAKGEEQIVTDVRNRNDFIKISNYPQEVELTDPDALVFRASEKMIYPHRQRSFKDSFAEIAFQQQAESGKKGIDIEDIEREAGGRDPRQKAENAIRLYTDYEWKRATEIRLLVTSTFKSAPMSKAGTPGGNYYSSYKVQDGYDGRAVQYQDHLDAEIIFARLKVISNQFAIVGAQDTQIVSALSFNYPSTETTAPIDLVRKSRVNSLPASQVDTFNRVDDEAELVAEAYFNSTRYVVGAEYRWFEIINPAGGKPTRNDVGEVVTDGIWYSTQMKTIMWVVDDAGAGTFVRYNTDDPYSPDVSAYRRQYVEFLNQQRQEHGVGTMKEFRRIAERMSGGSHEG